MGFSLRGKLKWGTVLAAAILMLILAVPTLADYLGPQNRFTTIWSEQRLNCFYQAIYHHYDEVTDTETYEICNMSLYHSPSESCPAADLLTVGGYFNDTSCSNFPEGVNCRFNTDCSIEPSSWLEPCSAGDYGCESIPSTSPVSEATINGLLQNCTLQNGWCVTGPSLMLVGTEPVVGYQILALEGTLNGQVFACPGVACTLPLIEGTNDTTFWAHSSWGDTSEMGMLSANVDTQPPIINGSVDGTPGDNGWYVSNADVSATASDMTSGVASFNYTLDGTAWTPYAGPLTLVDGSHSVGFQATDVAGHTYGISQTVNVDTEPPQASLTGSSGFCPGCGETLDLTFSAQDATSGIAVWELIVDGTSILASEVTATDQTLSWDGSGLPYGSHSLALEAQDVAGNTVDATLDVTILLPPSPVEDSGSDSTAPLFVAGPVSPLPTRTPAPARPDPQPTTVSFGSPAAEQPVVENMPADEGETIIGNQPPSTVSGPPSVLWGAAAAGLLGAVTAYAIDQRRKREEDEEQKAAVAAAFNADQRAADAAYDAKIAAAVAAKNAYDAYLAQQMAMVDRKDPSLQTAQDDYVRGLTQQRDEIRAISELDMTEDEQLAAHMATQQYQDYRQGLEDWEEQQAARENLGHNGKPFGMASIQPQQRQDDEGTWWDRLVDDLKDFWNWLITGERQDNQTPTPTRTLPPPNVTIIPAPTLTPTPTLAPTPTPTATPTASPWQPSYIIDNGVRFRSDPSTSAPILSEIQCGTTVQIGAHEVSADGHTWRPVIHNGTTGWIATEFMSGQVPVCPNFAAPGAIYPGAGQTVQIYRLPFDGSPSFWWGFGNNTFVHELNNDGLENRCGIYRRTTGLHSGNDFGLPPNTPLYWTGNVTGQVVSLNNQQLNFGAGPNNIVIRVGGFDFVFGETSANMPPLVSLDSPGVSPGAQIGYSGPTHLHLEIRPVSQNADERSSVVINPLTFFEPTLRLQWISLFAGDYALGGPDSPLSLGYYQNQVVQDCP